MTNLKKRYLSVKLAGQEIYTENIDLKGTLFEACDEIRERLYSIKESMPEGDWMLTIEEEYKQPKVMYCKSLDVATFECKEWVKKIQKENIDKKSLQKKH